MLDYKQNLSILFFLGLTCNFSYAEKASSMLEGFCKNYGPQTPRDINKKNGDNPSVFSFAPESKNLNLCNIHFHKNAEHKSTYYSTKANSGLGYQCNIDNNFTKLTKKELEPLAHNYCKGIKPGDTIEVHWVYSSCRVQPGKGLGSCLSEQCANPDLKAEAQVFLLVNDNTATNFKDFMYNPKSAKSNYHQTYALPSNTGKPVKYLGSATGEGLSKQECSNLSVSWSIRPQCARLDINSLNEW